MSEAMREAVARVESLAVGSSPVLVAGESGTEKELFASALHVGSAREQGPFIVVSCPPLAGDALERELFGWEAGAFDGAVAARPGRLELAQGGTLLLAEFREASPGLEARLMRFFAEGIAQRNGAITSTQLDVRVVTTTGDDPAAFIAGSALKAKLGR
ncbi:MAG TPA: sigma 54-interacting transcriptional regulator, partial [Polyangiaceae bacterium]